MNIRNICIIAHVDHGKTTLVDHILQQSDSFAQKNQTDRVMDSMDLERERGITIQAKNASVQIQGTLVNIVDTPGHADFGGEVERILDMVDGAILLVDGAEGPLPQTRFVLQKALQKGHKVILVINKVDRPECLGGGRVKEVVDRAFDLFVDLGASDEQADFPIIYACARDGWCADSWEEAEKMVSGESKGNLKPLFDRIVNYLPAPVAASTNDFQMMITNLGYSDYVGRLCIGRVRSGHVKQGQKLYRLGVHPETRAAIREPFTISKIFRYNGLEQVETTTAGEGQVIVLAGSDGFSIGDTITDNIDAPPMERLVVEEPTLAMIFSVNTSPFSGKDGEAIQSRKLRERLEREVRQNVALRFEETEQPDQFRVLGRGELQFAILIEQMRREGLEFMVARPRVLYKRDENGQLIEPIELATLDLPESYSGDVTRMLQERKGIMMSYEPSGVQTTASGTENRVRLEFEIPTRGLLGIRTKYLTATRGEGLFSSRLEKYAPFKGEMLHRNVGALVSDRAGDAVAYALFNLEDRGVLFIHPGEPVYEGMVIGEFNKENDLNVNPCKEKKLTNVRASGSDENVILKGVREMTLEKCIEWIDDDEWIEVTPKRIRLRKTVLQSNQRSIIRRSKDK